MRDVTLTVEHLGGGGEGAKGALGGRGQRDQGRGDKHQAGQGDGCTSGWVQGRASGPSGGDGRGGGRAAQQHHHHQQRQVQHRTQCDGGALPPAGSPAGSADAWLTTLCPDDSSAPRAATKATMARRPLMSSGAWWRGVSGGETVVEQPAAAAASSSRRSRTGSPQSSKVARGAGTRAQGKARRAGGNQLTGPLKDISWKRGVYAGAGVCTACGIKEGAGAAWRVRSGSSRQRGKEAVEWRRRRRGRRAVAGRGMRR